MPKLSLITPINLWNQDRLDKFLRCIKSVEEQTFKDFEWVIIDDGSSMEFDWENLLRDPQIPSVNIVHKEHAERVIAYNHAFQVAKGDWFAFLDSDDELKPMALERFNHRIEEFPKYKMLNFGWITHYEDGTYGFRDPFSPERKKVGHEVFGGGNIANGSFIFNRSVYEDLGGYPGGMDGWVKGADCTEINYPEYVNQPKPYIRDLLMNSPFNFSAAAQLEFPELRQYFMVDFEAEPEKILKELGNPWGQDFFLFFKYSRKYHSKAIKEYLYIIHPR